MSRPPKPPSGAMLKPCKLLKSGQSSSSSSPDENNETASTGDLISHLPIELLHAIVRRLTIKDAVRLSVLSHRWKHVCFTTPMLNFIPPDMFPAPKRRDFSEHREDYVRGVNKYLQFYHGTRVTYFGIAFRLGCEFTDDIDRWLGFAIRMGVPNIGLDLCCNKHSEAQTEGKYILRREVFDDCPKINLRKLTLVGCVLGPNFTDQFSSLVSLKLVSLPLANYDLQSMFGCLVNLKAFTLKRCTLPAELCLASLHVLGKLYIETCSGLKDVELPNVSSLQLDCVAQVIELKPCRLPNLECFIFGGVTGRQLCAIFSHLPLYLPNLKTLFLATKSAWVMHIPNNLAIFGKVTYLRLYFYQDTKFDIAKMVSVIQAFPSLSKLYLLISCPNDMEGSSKLNPSECVHTHLKHVEIGGFHGTSRQIEFAVYLLEHASLERLVIKPNRKNFAANGHVWSRQNVYEALDGFLKNTALTVL